MSQPHIPIPIIMFFDALIFKTFLSVCLLFLLFLLAIISLVLAIIVSLLQIYNILTGNYPPAYALSPDICNAFEREIIANYAAEKKLNLEDDYITIKVATYRVDIHSVILKNLDKPKLFWIHGVGSTAAISFVLSDIMHKLKKDFEIYAFDLPGFGRSSCPQHFKGATAEEVEDFYLDVILAYFDFKDLNNVYLCAHSFGAHIAIKFASMYPLKVQQLVLTDPAGLFPLLGKEGAYYSLIFKCGVPMYQIRSLGVFGSWIFNNIVMFVGENKRALYWFQVQASPMAMSDHIVAKFIRTNFVDSLWTRPNYRDLLGISMPVAFIYGEIDNIMPLHHGIIMSTLMGSCHPIYVVKGAWHMPMGFREGTDFAAVLKSILGNRMALPGQKSNYLLAAITALDTVHETFETRFTSYFSYKSTTNELIAFYHSLLMMRIAQQNSMDVAYTTTKVASDTILLQNLMNKLKRPPVMLTEGDEKMDFDIATHMNKEGLGKLLQFFGVNKAKQL